jgi:uncharacterized membrane protein YgcG
MTLRKSALMTKNKLLVLLVALGVPLSASADDPPPDVVTPPDASGIIGGEDAVACSWPTTVAVQGGSSLCTGTLVHPQVAVYAAHCGDQADKIRFGERVSPPSKTQSVDFCMTNPGYAGTSDQAHDWAFCKLTAPVDMAVTRVIFGCETSALQAGAQVAIVGFGSNTTNDTGAGTKRWAMTNINQVGGGTLSIGGQGTGVCPGDSGGPAFIEYPDGTWHAIGIASTVSGGCGGVGTHSRMDGAVQWIEENSGVDITPCHDVDGTWNPTPQCQGFQAGDAGQGYGAWAYWCDETPVGESSDTCGDPFDAIPDEDPPTVTITSPTNGTVYDTAPTTIDIGIDADDGSGWGVKEIALQINGELQPIIDEAAPWEFSGVTFPEGQWTLVAVAIDWADNEGRSEPIGIGVGQEAPDPEDPGADGGTSGDDGSGGGGGDDGSDGGGYPPGGPGAGDSDDRKGCGCATGGGAPFSAVLLMLCAARTRWRGRRTRCCHPS